MWSSKCPYLAMVSTGAKKYYYHWFSLLAQKLVISLKNCCCSAFVITIMFCRFNTIISFLINTGKLCYEICCIKQDYSLYQHNILQNRAQTIEILLLNGTKAYTISWDLTVVGDELSHDFACNIFSFTLWLPSCKGNISVGINKGGFL